jgi:hypothetical protein
MQVGPIPRYGLDRQSAPAVGSVFLDSRISNSWKGLHSATQTEMQRRHFTNFETLLPKNWTRIGSKFELLTMRTTE